MFSLPDNIRMFNPTGPDGWACIAHEGDEKYIHNIRKYEGKKPHGRSITRRGVYSKMDV
jgi:hypothetical protein